MHSNCQLSVHQRAAMQQLSAKVFKLSFEYLHFYTFIAQKAAILQKKYQYCISNVLSKVRFTQNIEIQPELDPLFKFEYPTVKVRRCP